MSPSRIRTWFRRIVTTRRAYRFFVRQWLPGEELRRAAGALASLRYSQIIEPVVMIPAARRYIVVIAPHPDDEAIGSGGTLTLAAESGCDIKIVFLSDGPQGAQRRVEAEAAAGALGARTIFLGWPTRGLPCGNEAQKALAAAIGSAAELLFLPFVLDDHDDHRRASELLMRAQPHLTCSPEVWAYQVYTAIPGNVLVDITEVQHRKESLIRYYETQMARRDWAHFARGAAAVASRSLPSSPRARFVEPFFVVPLKDYVDLCRDYFGPDARVCYIGDEYRTGAVQ